MARSQKNAERLGQTILFVDESGFYPLAGVARTWAPTGQTPVLKELCTYSHLSAMSALAPDGSFHISVKRTHFTQEDVVDFLRALLRKIPGRLLVIWDGAPVHRGKAVRAFLADGAAKRLQLERLPAYAPDLNPDEGIWSLLKNVELRNVCCRDLDHLDDELRKAIRRVRRNKSRLRACFALSGLGL